MTHDPTDRLLGWAEVRTLIGLGRTTAWRLRQAGDFPEPVQLSPGRVAWRAREIAAWNESRSAHPQTPAPPAPARCRSAAPQRRPSQAAPVARRPEPESTLPSTPTQTPPTLAQPVRRRRPAVAEGQLGFDF